MSKQFLNEINESKEVNESFQKEQFVKIKPDLTKYYIMVGIVLISIISLYFIMNQKVQIPDMGGWTLTDAQSWANNNEITLVATSEYSLETKNTIVSQGTDPGVSVSKNTTVSVLVSLGADPDEIIEIPDFDDTWTKTSIVSWLKEVQITNYSFTTETSETKNSNLFIEYSIDVNEDEFTRSDSIKFVVTSSVTSDTVTVISFTNYNKEQIDAWGKDNDINIQYIYKYSSYTQSGKVIDQSVDADEEIDQGSTIKITLSLGESVKIIDFSSYNQTDAKSWASENGISLSVTTAYSKVVSKGVAIYQSIPKDTVVAKGSSLKIIYSLGNDITIGSYINKPLTDFELNVSSLNELGALISLNISYQYSNSVSVNQIVSQFPSNTTIAIGDKIDVIVSLGKLVSVPDFNTAITADHDTLQEIYNAVLDLCNSPSNPINGRITLVDVEGDELTIHQSIISGTLISSSDVVDIIIKY